MPTTTAGPSMPYVILLAVAAGLLVLVLGTVFLSVHLAARRRWKRERRARELAGNPNQRLDGVLAGLAASEPVVRGTATEDDERHDGPDVEQAHFQVGGPAV
ncbi:hypothetical protein Xcel_1910 [Xylanimonas cellulosilytica DSM 15894]|uniref:Uncharacterized protein n=1 Tax=Xylanimonas cellulosilytica (strain DSM 15894 / JCM 12276 / CECT 5975 / KCTC 9989 / LMG 20990 / NBRC 107835 / XIL07) TaxID=446471 RepID=D1BT87_XYLCX|nr:hypothetical protein [Xylanimonas cellulosilytica]ACZ30929.1 hypothetical protein Xcel_1910 [Xylanimonas cellulosilytica DSM 15894]